jgi:hypothetical protein
MIHHLFVIDHGISIYTHDFIKESTIDPQLLSGFLAAVGSFANEAFKTGLQTISIRNGEKLNFYVDPAHGLIFCAISNEKDNSKLLEQILGRIASGFTTHFASALQSPARSNIDLYRAFNDVVPSFVKRKDKKRNAGTMIQGLLLGALFFFASFFAFVALIKYMASVAEVVATYYLSVALFFSSAISGFFAGNQSMGWKNGTVFFAMFIAGILWLVPQFLIFLIMFLPFAFIVCAAGGSWGGLRCDMNKLYPLARNELRKK